ncbi:MAG TPA: Ig-like domain-containing protein, partial [Gemmataceae bacterium]|nr:Ig-like domain-containing protein [Gemmataceae bacterium]
MPATEPDDTLDQAQSLGDLSVAPRAEAVGTIGDGAAGPADVDWYSFQLDRAANVTLSSPPSQAGAPSITTLSLYGSDPNDPNDPYDPLGYNLIDQSDSADLAGGARIDQRLAAGTYYVAVSGSGNHYIYPFLAGSGGVGATGDYGLLLTAADLGLGPNDGPAVLTSDPQPGAALDRSPFLIRIDMSEPLNAQTVSAGTTVQLLSNATGTFGDGTDQVVALANASLNPAGTKLLIAPAAPLTPSYYKVVLAGNSMANSQVLTDQSGNALGATSDNSTGADFSYTFHVLSNEGNAAGSSAADDTPATAHQLGDISNLPLRQISGAIGDDSSDPIAFDPADVNLYHFQINESGQHAFIAEVFAGRIGSPLFPALSLFRADGNGQLTLQASNAGTMNGTAATNGQVPLFNDPVLYAGLTQGDYYLAVSGMGNVSDPIAGPAPGTNGVFDPTISHSGQAGFTTGPYLLNLHVHSDNTPPQVITTTPQEGDALTAPPTDLLVQFSEPINLQQAAYFESQQTGQNNLDAVYLQGSDGTKYYPRLISYDGSTQQAHFQLLDGLPNGTYQLHLSNSGPYGLTDLAGNPLAGNDPSGDYVVHFSVQGPTRGSNGNPLQWYDQEPNDSVNQPQDLGVLFPHELQSGVTITRDPSLDPGTTYADSADYYRFQVLQSRDYIVSLSGTGLPNGTLPTFTDASGNSVPTLSQGTGGGVRVTLDAGTYVMGVGGWDPSTASTVAYQLQISLAAAAENPIPLTI